MKNYTLILFILIGTIACGSCDRKSASSTVRKPVNKTVSKITSIKLTIPGTKVVTGEDITFTLPMPDTTLVDSVQVYFRGKLVGTYTKNPGYSISTIGSNPGRAGLRVKVFFTNGKSEIDSIQVEILSDIVPKTYRYSVVNTYKHDIGAYTQGLQYYNGLLYEGTGNYNQSSIRKVKLENGEIIQIRNNESNIFGEGITIFKDKIYQLTYKSQVCFVYDLNTFEEVQKFSFQNNEGWGLTNNGKELIMSDGTNIIYFIDPQMFTVIRQIEVYNNEDKVDSLNELEFIGGKIYANRYYTDEIVIIDPETGKEEARVNMKGILAVKDRSTSTNVLNGIAWDKEQNRLFVTGKYWPKLFEIQLFPVSS